MSNTTDQLFKCSGQQEESICSISQDILTLKTPVTHHSIMHIGWLCDCPRNLTASPPAYCGFVAGTGIFTEDMWRHYW